MWHKDTTNNGRKYQHQLLSLSRFGRQKLFQLLRDTGTKNEAHFQVFFITMLSIRTVPAYTILIEISQKLLSSIAFRFFSRNLGLVSLTN